MTGIIKACKRDVEDGVFQYIFCGIFFVVWLLPFFCYSQELQGDSAENLHHNAVAIPISGEGQSYNFDKLNDVDWVMFYALYNKPYTIETIDLETRADTVIRVYDSDGETLLKERNDRFEGEKEVLSWRAPYDGVFYVSISQSVPEIYGDDTGYTLLISRPIGLSEGIVVGTVFQTTGVGASSALIKADSTLCNPVLSFPDGSYIMPCSVGSFTVSAELSGYETSSQSVTVTAEGTTYQDFSLSSSISVPSLTTSVSGNTVTATWSAISNASSYTLYYAPAPYEGEHTIENINMGTSTSILAELPSGTAFYVAITSWGGGIESGYSNIGYFQIQ